MNNKKKILIIVDTLKTGGAARQISLLAECLSKKEIYIDIFFYKHNFDEIFYNKFLGNNYINFFYLKKPKYKSGFNLNIVIKIYLLMQRENYNSVLSYQYKPSIYTLIASLFTSKKVKKIFSLRNSPYTLNKLMFLKILFLIFTFDKVIVNSFTYKDFLNSKLLIFKNFFKSKVKVVLNGYKEFSTSKNISISKKPTNFLVLARISPVKGGKVFASGLRLFLERNNINLKVKWGGTCEDTEVSRKEYKEVNKIIENSDKLTKNWEWVGQTSNVDKLYFWADLIIIPSTSEGMSNVLCESMCRGKFIISSKVGDYEFLISDKNGIVFDNNSPQSLCVALEKFFKMNHKKRLQICKNAYKFAKNNLNIEKTAKAYMEIFEL